MDRLTRTHRTALLAGVASLALILTACGGSSSKDGASSVAPSKYGFTTAKQTSGKLLVWVDSTRLDAAKLYQSTHPNVPIQIVTYDGNANGSNTLQTKVQLYDRAGKGWPDVAFTTDDNSASWAAQKNVAFTAPLNKGLIPQATLDGFAKGAFDPCTIDGTVYCLRNDLAQEVLWYNDKLMKQFGYTVPTTWEDYQALGQKVAKDHPGYLIGAAGDAWTPEIYFWASQCPANNVTGARSISVNTADPKCARMASLLDTLIANKSMSIESIFGASFIKNKASKVLMMPGPSWYGGALFQGTLKTPKGEVAVAAPLKWAADPKLVTGNVGGGAWWLSSHTAHLKAATDFLTWVTTNDAYQVDKAPGYPAYTAAAQKWIAKQVTSGYYANDISGPINDAANQVWSGWGSPQFSQEAVWASTMTPAMTAGKTVTSLLPAWGTAIKNKAQVTGYSVK